MTPEKSDIEFGGPHDGMGNPDEKGSYVMLSIWRESDGKWCKHYIVKTQAEALGIDLIKASR